MKNLCQQSPLLCSTFIPFLLFNTAHASHLGWNFIPYGRFAFPLFHLHSGSIEWLSLADEDEAERRRSQKRETNVWCTCAPLRLFLAHDFHLFRFFFTPWTFHFASSFASLLLWMEVEGKKKFGFPSCCCFTLAMSHTLRMVEDTAHSILFRREEERVETQTLTSSAPSWCPRSRQLRKQQPLCVDAFCTLVEDFPSLLHLSRVRCESSTSSSHISLPYPISNTKFILKSMEIERHSEAEAKWYTATERKRRSVENLIRNFTHRRVARVYTLCEHCLRAASWLRDEEVVAQQLRINLKSSMWYAMLFILQCSSKHNNVIFLTEAARSSVDTIERLDKQLWVMVG